MSSRPPSDKHVGLVTGPRPLVTSCISVSLRVGEFEFPAQWVPAPERTAAATFVTQFERSHRVVVHELLKIAREAIAGSTAPTISCKIAAPPTVSEAHDLVFYSTLEPRGDDSRLDRRGFSTERDQVPLIEFEIRSTERNTIVEGEDMVHLGQSMSVGAEFTADTSRLLQQMLRRNLRPA